MKNQYFGDFGDYQKFSLLKTLRDIGKLSVTVHWMKTKDDGSNDGKKITYLKDVDVWDIYDKDIFDFIKTHLDQKIRNLDVYEQSIHASKISFINEHIEEESVRQSVLQDIKKDKSDVVFFDPDNGIEVQSTNKKNLYKYVLWNDIEYAFGLGKSILVYQHFSRKNRDTFINEKVQEFKKRFNNTVFVIKVKHSVYFLLTQEKHVSKVQKALDAYSKIWKELVSVKN